MKNSKETLVLSSIGFVKRTVFIVLLCLVQQVVAKIDKVDLGEFYIEYEAAGQSKFVIILEAGAGGDLTRWDAIFNDLSLLGHTIRYTRIGNEAISQIKRQFSAEEYAYHLHLFLQKLGISKPVIVVSHSYGALITRMFAANYPNQIAGMLLIDPNTEADNDIMRSIDLEEANRKIAEWTLSSMKGGKDQMSNDVLDYWSRRPMPRYPQIRDIPIRILVSSKKYEPTPHIFFTDEGRAKKAKWHKQWASEFPRAKVVITTKSGHSIDLSEPELVFTELRGLVKTVLKDSE